MPVYTRKSRLSRAKRLRLLEHFVAGTTARAAAELVGVNRNMKNRFYLALRQIIAEEMEKTAPLHVEVEGSGRKKATPATGAKAGEVGSGERFIIQLTEARQTRLHALDFERQGEGADADPRVSGGAGQHRLYG